MNDGNKENKDLGLDTNHLIELANYRMPFGKYKDQLLVNIPEPYFTWFKQKGFPEGKLGNMMREMDELKVNGLEYLLKPFIERRRKMDGF